MKQRLIEKSRGLLITLMNHCVLASGALLAMGLFGEEKSYMALWTAMVLVPLCFQFTRKNIHNFFLFFALHLVLVVTAVMLPLQLIMKIVVSAVVLIYAIWSVSIRLKERTNEDELLHPIFSVCVIGVAALGDSFLTKSGWDTCYLVFMLFYFGCYFVYYFINQFLYFLRVNESSAANIPKQEIFTSGMKQTILFTACGLLLLFLSANIGWFAYIMSWLGKGIVVFLRMLLSGRASVPEEEIVEASPMQGEMDFGFLGAEKENPFLLWVILEKILMVLVPLAMISLVVFGVVMAFRYLWKRFHVAYEEKDQRLETGMDIREKCSVESMKKEGAGFFTFLNNRQKVRKMYRKLVLKNKTRIVGDHNTEDLEYLTARECCDLLAAEHLRLVYEKARYTENDITIEDIRMIKAAGK